MGEILGQLGLDQTYVIQFGIFIAAFFLLTQFYFKPFLKIIEARNKAIHANKADADAAAEKARQMFDEYQTAIRLERQASKKQLEEALAEAKKEEERLLASARAEAREITLSAMQELAKQESQIRASLAKDVEALSAQLAGRLL